MYLRTNLVYQYDGSLEGFFCCVFRAVYQREQPSAIFSGEDPQLTLLEQVEVPTEADKAARVARSLPEKLGSQAPQVIRLAFLSDLENKELTLLAFLRMGYQIGPKVMRMLADAHVQPVLSAAQQVGHEAHLFKGFTRFSDYGSCLVAEIEPKNHVLPLLAQHFRVRMPGESFLIVDRTHRLVLAHSGGCCQIFPMDQLELPAASQRETLYRQLWTRFYDAISIETRYNPKCRQSNMPKRYWGMMTEFQEENRASGPQAPAFPLREISAG